MTMVNFNREKLRQFKKIYLAAVEDKKEIFIFDGEEYVTGYAKYVIEYLENKFKKQQNLPIKKLCPIEIYIFCPDALIENGLMETILLNKNLSHAK